MWNDPAAASTTSQSWAIPEKIQTGGGGDIEFPGVSKKWHMEFKVANENESGISKGDQEKIIWNFQESLFLELEFIRVLTQFCGISRG